MASLAALVPSGTACGTPPLSIVANSAVNSGLSTHLSPSSVDLAHSHHQQLNHHHAPNSGEIPTLTSPLAGSGYYPSYYHHHQSISHHHHHHHESYQAPVEETGAFFPYHHASGHHQSWPSVTTGASPSTELLMNDYSSVAPTTMAPYPEYEYSHRFMVDPHHHAHQQCQIPPTPLTSSANSTSSSMSSSSSASPPRQIHRGFEAGVEHLHQPPNNLSHMAAYSQPGGEFVSTNASQQVENASSLPVTESTSINHLGQNVTVTSKTQQDGTITTVVTTTTSTGRVVRVVKKRNTANKKERRRTQSINNAFAELRECIPNVPSDTKLSKIKTLRLATSYIAYLMDLIGEDSSSASTAPSTSAEPESTPDAMLAQHSNEMAQQAQSYSNMQPNLNNDNCVGLRVGDLASFNHYNMAQLHSGCRGGKDSDSAYSKSPSLHQSCGSPTTMSPPTTPNGGFDSPTNVGMNSGLMHQLDDPNRPEEDLRIKEESMEMSASGVVGGPMGHPGDSSSSTSPVFSSDFPNNKRVRGRTGWPQQMWAHELKQI